MWTDAETFEGIVVSPLTELLDSSRGGSDHRGGPDQASATSRPTSHSLGSAGVSPESRISKRSLPRPGFTSCDPEELPLVEQLATYLASDEILFSEGSAIHVLQLLGSIPSRTSVLVRRPGYKLAIRSLAPRALGMDYHEVSAGIAHGLLPSGKPALSIGMSILDENALLDALDGGFSGERRAVAAGGRPRPAGGFDIELGVGSAVVVEQCPKSIDVDLEGARAAVHRAGRGRFADDAGDLGAHRKTRLRDPIELIDAG